MQQNPSGTGRAYFAEFGWGQFDELDTCEASPDPERKVALSFVADCEITARGYLKRWSFLDLLKGFVMDSAFLGEVCGRWLEILPHYPDGAAFGGLIGSATEIGNFLTDLIRPRSVLLGRDTKALFLSPQTANGKAVPMTLGWHIAARFLFKEDGGAGFRAEMRLYPRQSLDSVILANATGLTCQLSC